MARLLAVVKDWLFGQRPSFHDPAHEQVLARLREQEARLRTLDAQVSAQKAAKR